MAGEVYGLYWYDDDDDSTGDDIRSLWSLDNPLPQPTRYNDLWIRFGLRHRILAIPSFEIFCRFCNLRRIFSNLYPIWRVRRAKVPTSLTDSDVVCLLCNSTDPSIDGVFCENMENSHDIM